MEKGVYMECAESGDYEIQRLLERLDQVSVDHEAVWGINVLPGLVDMELRKKWDAQWEKLNAAIEAKDIDLIRDLTEGCVRGWNALAICAAKNGHKPTTDEYWSFQHRASGRVYRIC